MSRLRRLLRLPRGEAAAGPALALASVALLSVFLGVAGPRELAHLQVTALRSAVSGVPQLSAGVLTKGEWTAAPGPATLSPAAVDELTADVARQMRPPIRPDLAHSWSAATSQPQLVLDPPARAVLSNPPTLEIAYRSALAANARLSTGSLPDAVTQEPASGSSPGAAIFDVAATPATAARFGLRIGSQLSVGPGAHGPVLLRLTGIVQPLRPAGAFWQADPELLAPLHPFAGMFQIWAAGVLIGPRELSALQAALTHQTMQGEWFVPLSLRGLTPARLPALLSGLRALAASSPGQSAGPAAVLTDAPVTSSGLGVAISSFEDQQRQTRGIDSLLLVDEFIAVVVLMLVCSAVAAMAHGTELSLLRTRGASTGQLARRLLARTCAATIPAAVAGAALAVALVPADRETTGLQLGGLAALTALAGPAVIAAWTYRRGRADPAARRGDLTVLRPSRRRSVAELTVVIVAAAAVTGLRLRGTTSGNDPYISAAPVLVAAAVALLAGRLYPAPLRAMLPVTARTRGPVGFLGVTRAARARLGAIMPAVALILSLTLAAFATMVLSAVASGQSAQAWRQTGADALITEPGAGHISPAAAAAIGRVPGVRLTVAATVAGSHSPLAVTLTTGGSSAPAGLVVAEPAGYAALAAQTPWPDFPAADLSRARAAGGRVPVLVSGLSSSQQAAGPGSAGGTLNLGGTELAVRIAATIGRTPAMPSGGPFVVLPAWAAPRLPVIGPPDTLLVTGRGIDATALRAAVARYLPGAQLTVRAQVLSALAHAPARLASERLYRAGLWVAVLLSVIAVFLSLAASAGSRGQLIDRLTALGMAARQARAVAVAELLPLATVAVLGTAAAALVLAIAVGPELDLGVFAGPAGRPLLRLVPGAFLPVAAALIVAAAVAAAQSARLARRDVTAALRQEEAR
ncbi:MAG TPA: hypothetical protein VGI64_08310 [Streptosporangiaceae bacterium]